jgi:hypothetical protein
LVHLFHAPAAARRHRRDPFVIFGALLHLLLMGLVDLIAFLAGCCGVHPGAMMITLLPGREL